MRKLIMGILILTLIGVAACGCSEKKKTTEEVVPVETFNNRFEQWKEDKSQFLSERKDKTDYISGIYEGVTTDGYNYKSMFLDVDGKYRSAEIAVTISEDSQLMYKYFDLGDDLLFFAVVHLDNEEDQQPTDRYFIYKGTKVYIYDYEKDTYSEGNLKDMQCLVYDDVIAAYSGDGSN